MLSEIFGYLAATLTIAAMHATLPTHWLPFALVGRAQRWPVMKTVSVTMLAGLGHVSMTTLVGFLAAWVGLGMHHVAEGLTHQLSGWILIGFGAVYALFDLRHIGHRHAMDVDFSETAAVMSFVTMLTVSPCIALIPIFFAVSRIGWIGISAVAIVNMLVTIPLMVCMVWIAASGLEKLKLTGLQRHERTIVGVMIVLLGIGTMVWHRH